MIQYTDPDAILLTETKLDDTISSSEFLPPHYTSYRRNRDRHGGGVLVAIKSCYPTEAVEFDGKCESVWATVTMRNSRRLVIGSFYRPPGDGHKPVDQLNAGLHQLSQTYKNNRNTTFILGGDFNVPHINWEDGSVRQCNDRKTHEAVLGALRDNHLTQMQLEPTRLGNILDLMCTNKPGLVKAVTTIPGISDHEAVIADHNIRPEYRKKLPRKVHKYKEADWDKIKRETVEFAESYTSGDNTRDVENNWSAIRDHLTHILESLIPSKMTTTRYNLPWLDTRLKRMCKKKHRMYNAAKKANKQKKWDAFQSFKKNTQKALKTAHLRYLRRVLTDSAERKESKPFWRYIKSQRQENFGVATLKRGGIIYNDPKDRAEILNDQFRSVFTKDTGEPAPQPSGDDYPSIKSCVISEEGVLKLLQELDPSKASGPDDIPCRLLKALAVELAPVYTAFFTQSLREGVVPSEWRKARVTPIFKKGSIHEASNYRPVSLTCVSCKLMEHIICHHVRAHLEEHSILSPFQHGFRGKRSPETQLIVTLHDFMNNWNAMEQVDMAVLDFSKAFDTVPHRSLLNKLSHYGVDGTTRSWIGSFLSGRDQVVLVEGRTSESVPVESGVPQGSVLGPLLFLIHINDLPDVLDRDTKVRLFADDCLVYRTIHTLADQITLQNDLDSLQRWSEKWGMKFHPKKCNIMRLSRKRKPLTRLYTLCNHTLEQVSNVKYLGININENLDWAPQVQAVCQKANTTLSFLRRNLKSCPPKLKEVAYISLVRSVVECAATVWSPYEVGDKKELEKIQRRTARFVKGDYIFDSSVDEMVKSLGWTNLEDRRRELRLALLYKIIHGHVEIPTEGILRKAGGRTRAKNNNSYAHLSFTRDEVRYSFFPDTIVEWNKLPDSIIECSTVAAFKRGLHKRVP